VLKDELIDINFCDYSSLLYLWEFCE